MEDDNKSILIANFHPQFKFMELMHMFEEGVGGVVGGRLIKNSTSEPIALITFDDSEDAKKAVHSFNNSEINKGINIIVQISPSEPSDFISINQVEKRLDELRASIESKIAEKEQLLAAEVAACKTLMKDQKLEYEEIKKILITENENLERENEMLHEELADIRERYDRITRLRG